MDVNFYLAQYLQDPIRREPKNVGVIVGHDGRWAGKFLGGTTADGLIDMRTVTWTKDVKGYRQWVRFWNDRIARGGDDLIDRLMKTNGGNYDVIRGGHLTGVGGDTAEQIVANLFPVLVEAPKTFSFDIAPEPEVEATEIELSTKAFKRDVTNTFRDMGLLGGHKQPEELKRPIYSDSPVIGKRVQHTPAYVHSGAYCVMEVVNFATPRKVLAKDHAGWTAKMFDDIWNFDGKTRGIALVHGTAEDLREKNAEYSLALLQDSAKEIVHWHDKDQRKDFLEARRVAAYAASA